MVALGLWTGTASDEELAVEVTRFGGESLYAARLANALQGAAQHQVLLAEQAATDGGATPEQIDAARHQASPGDAFENGSALAAVLRWQVLRLGLVLRQVNRDDVGPVWLAAAHAADGLQHLLNVCGIASPDDPQGETLPEDLTDAMEALANARANVEILTTLAGATPAEPSHAYRKTAQARRDFTDEQVAMLIDRFDTTLHQVGDIVDMWSVTPPPAGGTTTPTSGCSTTWPAKARTSRRAPARRWHLRYGTGRAPRWPRPRA